VTTSYKCAPIGLSLTYLHPFTTQYAHAPGPLRCLNVILPKPARSHVLVMLLALAKEASCMMTPRPSHP
jgi:hypothetical protein